MPRGSTLTNGNLNGDLRNASIAPANGEVYCGSRYKAFREILSPIPESRFQMGETRQTSGSTTDARLHLSHIQMEIIKTITRIDAVALADANILEATRSWSEVLEVQNPLLRSRILKQMKDTNRHQAEARDKTVWWDSNVIFAASRETSYGCKEQRVKFRLLPAPKACKDDPFSSIKGSQNFCKRYRKFQVDNTHPNQHAIHCSNPRTPDLRYRSLQLLFLLLPGRRVQVQQLRNCRDNRKPAQIKRSNNVQI
ncbi:hypothetical protein EV421DRAFT_1736170 [Armillaria borealis]|uniref:Uncharacterized protein n=1 Tax=Armillaria borealis TaxID=47425 RepID=A0AA39JH31_9AGAR|nr:hypothetical protein EV421DRAFT_1736170 [Armillaria borealis]